MLSSSFNSTCCNTVERGVGLGANVSTSLFNKIPYLEGHRKEVEIGRKNVTERAEATLNLSAKVKRVNFVKEEKIVKITYLKR